MVSLIRNLLPDSIDGIIESFERDENEQYSLTLLHKTDNSIYCFLSGNLQGIDSNLKIPFGMTLALAKRRRVRAHYDVVFDRQDIEKGHYFLFSEADLFTEESKSQVIPFLFGDELPLPYAVVDRGLRKLLLEYMQMGANNRLEAIERVGEYGVLRSIIYTRFNGDWKKKGAQISEAGMSLKSRVTELFHEYNSPSTLIHPVDYRPEDRKQQTMFTNQKFPVKAWLIPLIYLRMSFMPYSAVITDTKEDFQTPYEKRFKLIKSKEEEVNILLSDFAMAHPKAIDGLVRILEFMKHTANVTTYAALVGLTALAYQYAHPAISYPMMAVSSLSGLTMLGNVVRSHGRDSSGLISTFLERKMYNKLN